jgi:hypothetical protein
MDNVKLYAGLVLIAILIAPFVLQPWIESRIHRPSLVEKHGRLVDVRTSAPLANATVVFHWYRHQRYADCLIERATTTDANGAFAFPDVSGEATFVRSWLGAVVGTATMAGYYTASYDYTITVYAPGSALVAPRRTMASPPDLAYWLTDPPGHEVRGTIEIDPIRVVPTSFSPADEIAYLARLKTAFICDWPGRTEPPEVTKAKREIVARIRPLPCAIPAETMIGYQVVDEYVMAVNDRRVEKALAPPDMRLGPAAWRRDVRADELCKAVTE